jgi:6-phosphogluconolactonase
VKKIALMAATLAVLAAASALYFSAPSSAKSSPQYLYTNDNAEFNGNTSSGYSVSGATLTLIPGSPFATGGTATGGGAPGLATIVNVALTPTEQCVYVSDDQSYDVAAFVITPSSGALTPTAGSPFATGGSGNPGGIGLAATADHKYLFAANTTAQNTAVFDIQSDCSLQLSQLYTAHGAFSGMTVTPSGQFLVASYATQGTDAIDTYTIGAGGALTENGPFNASGVPNGVLSSCNSKVAVFGDIGEGTGKGTEIEAFSISARGGLAPIAGSPFLFNSGDESLDIIMNVATNELFVSNLYSRTVSALDIHKARPYLTLQKNSPFNDPGVGTPGGLALSANGKVLFVAQGGDSSPEIVVYNVNADGTLTNANGSPVKTGRPIGLESLVTVPAPACAP